MLVQNQQVRMGGLPVRHKQSPGVASIALESYLQARWRSDCGHHTNRNP